MTNLTIFYTDDDEDDLSIFADAVESLPEKIQLNTYNGGDKLLSAIYNPPPTPHVIFLDLNMPRMGGKECLTEIKGDEKLHKIPVIMYTTSSQSKDIEETMQKGAICFITKPTNMKELKNILSSIAGNVHSNLEKTLRLLSNNTTTFIVC